MGFAEVIAGYGDIKMYPSVIYLFIPPSPNPDVRKCLLCSRCFIFLCLPEIARCLTFQLEQVFGTFVVWNLCGRITNLLFWACKIALIQVICSSYLLKGDSRSQALLTLKAALVSDFISI